MPEFLDDRTSVALIGVIATLIVGATSCGVVLFVNRRAKRRRLWYEFNTIRLLTKSSVSPDSENLEIRYKGAVVPDVYRSTIGIWYEGPSGSVIKEEDYRKSLTFGFGEAQILEAVIESESSGLETSLQVEGSSVIFSNMAMNNGNAYRAKVIHTPFVSKKGVSGLILVLENGLEDIANKRTPEKTNRILFPGAVVVLLTIVGFGSPLYPGSFTSLFYVVDTVSNFVFFVGIAVGFYLMVRALLHNRRGKKEGFGSLEEDNE